MTNFDPDKYKYHADVIIYIEHCQFCNTHNWCTWHDENKYLEAYKRISKGLNDFINVYNNQQEESIYKVDFRVKDIDNKCSMDTSRKSQIYPRLGSFEVSCQVYKFWAESLSIDSDDFTLFENTGRMTKAILLFSKLQTKTWPNLSNIEERMGLWLRQITTSLNEYIKNSQSTQKQQPSIQPPDEVIKSPPENGRIENFTPIVEEREIHTIVQYEFNILSIHRICQLGLHFTTTFPYIVTCIDLTDNFTMVVPIETTNTEVSRLRIGDELVSVNGIEMSEDYTSKMLQKDLKIRPLKLIFKSRLRSETSFGQKKKKKKVVKFNPKSANFEQKHLFSFDMTKALKTNLKTLQNGQIMQKFDIEKLTEEEQETLADIEVMAQMPKDSRPQSASSNRSKNSQNQPRSNSQQSNLSLLPNDVFVDDDELPRLDDTNTLNSRNLMGISDLIGEKEQNSGENDHRPLNNGGDVTDGDKAIKETNDTHDISSKADSYLDDEENTNSGQSEGQDCHNHDIPGEDTHDIPGDDNTFDQMDKIHRDEEYTNSDQSEEGQDCHHHDISGNGHVEDFKEEEVITPSAMDEIDREIESDGDGDKLF